MEIPTHVSVEEIVYLVPEHTAAGGWVGLLVLPG